MGLVSRSFKWLANPDGSFDGDYPTGDKPPEIQQLEWNIGSELQAAGIETMIIGTPFSHNVRQYLSGTNAATATISFVLVTGDDPTTNGWTAPGSGNNIAYDAVAAKSGTFRLRATDAEGSVDSAIKAWACSNPASVPAKPTGNTATVISSSQINQSWDTTPNATSYKVKRGGATIATGVTATSYAHTGLTPSTQYSFTVIATNGAGDSVESDATLATTAAPGGGSYTPPFPRLFLRQALSNMNTLDVINSLADFQTACSWAAKFNSSMYTGVRGSTFGGGAYHLGNVPDYIKTLPTYAGGALIKYTNNTQVASPSGDSGASAAFVRAKLTSEVNGTGGDWVIRNPRKSVNAATSANPIQITTSSAHGLTTGQDVNVYSMPGDFGTNLNGNNYTITVVNSTQFTIPVNGTGYAAYTSGGAVSAPRQNKTTNWETNFYSVVTADSENSLKWSQWYPRFWFAAYNDSAADYVIGTGHGIREGAWDGVFCDDQSMLTGQAATVSGGDIDEDGSSDSSSDADMKTARAQGFVDTATEWRGRFAIHAKGTLKYFTGNITAICSFNDIWPTNMRTIYNGGLIEEVSGKSKTRGFGDYNVHDDSSTGQLHSGMMGLYWRGMENCIDPKLVAFGHEADPEFRTKWGGNPNNPTEPGTYPAKSNNWITDGGVRKYPGSPSDFSDWRLLRWALACCLMDDGYFSSNQTTLTWTTGLPWYDEYVGGEELDIVGWLGQRVGAVPRAAYSQGVWLAEFENGLVVMNPPRGTPDTDQTKTITLPSAGTGKRWKRLKAKVGGYTTDGNSGLQDSATNNNQFQSNSGATSSLTIKELDAIFFRRVNA